MIKSKVELFEMLEAEGDYFEVTGEMTEPSYTRNLPDVRVGCVDSPYNNPPIQQIKVRNKVRFIIEFYPKD